MMTGTQLTKAIKAYKTEGAKPVYFKDGTNYLPIDTIESRNGYVKITFFKGENKVATYPTPDKLYTSKPEPFTLCSQKPLFKVGDLIKVKSRAKQMPPYITDKMRGLRETPFLIKEINPNGYYKLDTNADSYPAYINDSLWANEWLTKITRGEYDELKLAKPISIIIERLINNMDTNLQGAERRATEAGQNYQNVYREYMIALETKNKSKATMASEKKAQFIKDIITLRKDKRIVSVDISNDAYVTVTTHPLELTTSNIAVLMKYTNLPAYKIKVGFGDGGNITVTVHGNDQVKTDCSYAHPHVSSWVCMGNMAPIIKGAVARFDVITAFHGLLELLQSYHSSNPYIKLSNFLRTTIKCDSCSSPIVATVCEECGKKYETEEPTLKPIQ